MSKPKHIYRLLNRHYSEKMIKLYLAIVSNYLPTDTTFGGYLKYDFYAFPDNMIINLEASIRIYLKDEDVSFHIVEGFAEPHTVFNSEKHTEWRINTKNISKDTLHLVEYFFKDTEYNKYLPDRVNLR